MTSDALLVVQTLFGTILSLFNSWYIPGTHTTPFEFAVFALAFAFVIKIVRYIFSLGGDRND